MLRKTTGVFLMVVAVVGFQALMSGAASAHDVHVVASGVCVENVATINFTANETFFAFSNPSIGIFFNDINGVGNRENHPGRHQSQVTGYAVAPRPTGGGSTSALYREALLKRAGEDAGERILRALHLIAPKTN